MITINLRLFCVLILVLVLSIIPLPDIMIGIRPPWILLFVLYIQFFLPNYFNLISLFLLGLSLDVLLSTVIGEHVFALLLTTWFAAGRARRFRFFSMGQQMILVALFCFIYQFILFLIDSFLGYNNALLRVAGTTLLSLFLWPWVMIVLDSTFRVKAKGIYT